MTIYISMHSFLKILAIYLCCCLGKRVLHAANDVFVTRHATTALNCTCFDQNESTWRVLKTSKVRPLDTNVVEKRYIPYTQGLLLNPKLKNSNINVSGNYTSGECNLIIRNFTNDDVGIYICEYWKGGSVLIDAYHLFLQNPPNIKINHTITDQEITIVCSPSAGMPNNYTFDLWEHHSEFKELIRRLKGTDAGTLTITKTNSSNRLHENDGIYTCAATNGIVGESGSLFQKGSIVINEKVPPIFLNSNNAVQYGGPGQTIVYTMILYNKFGTIKTYISHQNESLKLHTIQERILTHDMFYNVNVTIYGIRITFEQILDIADDITNYSIKACNKKGCNEAIVQIIKSTGNTTSSLVVPSTGDDFHVKYPYGYCWIIMGSIIGGILIFCIGTHIFCCLKRAKALNTVLQIPQGHNYDEIGTLNYNNDIFDPIAHVAEVSGETVSSIPEHNDKISGTDVVSSNDSSSITHLGDGYENPYQTIYSGNIETHHYSSIINENYQNTIIFSSESVTKPLKTFNNALDSCRQPWLVIYMKNQ